MIDYDYRIGDCISVFCYFVLFFFKQKTAYEMRISDWSSDVCSSDLAEVEWMAAREWARTTDDVLWRRSKLGLHFTEAEVGRLRACLEAIAAKPVLVDGSSLSRCDREVAARRADGGAVPKRRRPPPPASRPPPPPRPARPPRGPPGPNT